MAEKIFDIHSHVLPGIDDGAKDWDMTVEMLRRSYEAGVRCVFATPHYLPWRNSYQADEIPKLCEEAMWRLKEAHGIEMPVLPGQELYYHAGILDDIESGRAITMAGSRYALVEFAEDAPYSQIREAAAKFRRSRYRMIIAHCERFSALRDKKHLEEILETGARLQSNAEEILKGPFSGTKRWLKARYGAEEIMYIGSDMHNITDRPPINGEMLQWFRKHIGEDDPYRAQLFYENAAHLAGKA